MEAPPVTARVTSAAYEPQGRLPQVSVVVSSFERATFLGTLVGALEAQSLGLSRFEVVVVDDGSADDTWSRLGALAATTRLRLVALRLGHRGGQGPGRNVGVGHARGQVVAFTDDDCVPDPGWLETITAPLLAADRTACPGLVVQGRTVPWQGDASGAGPWARTLWVLGPTWLFETCNIAYRKDDLVAAGGFPKRGEAPASASGKLVGEDALAGWRVIERGADLVFEPSALVYHRHFPATYLEWLLDHRGKAVFPTLVRVSPLARRALWARWFLAKRTAAFDVALLGGLLAALTRRGRWLLATVPWVWMALPDACRREGRHPALRLVQLAGGDLMGFGSLASGSVRSRTVVL